MIQHLFYCLFSLYLILGILFLKDNVNQKPNRCYIWEYVLVSLVIHSIFVCIHFKKLIYSFYYYIYVSFCGLILTSWGTIELFSKQCTPRSNANIFQFAEITTFVQGIVYIVSFTALICTSIIDRDLYEEI